MRRELFAFFVSPMAYIVLAVFLAVTGLRFAATFELETQQFAYGAIISVLRDMSRMFLFLLPLLTMRLVAEEFHAGTIEPLMTAPVSNTAVVVSKFLGAFSFLIVMLLPTLAFPVILDAVAGERGVDVGPVIAGYFGLFLLGGTVISAGVFVSACVRNQISAAVATVLILVLLWVAGSATAGTAPGWLAGSIRYLGLLYHYDSFAKGVIDTRDVVYHVTASGVFLFAAVGVIAVRRWR
ncbi:MAG: ABC transporter permease [bacterium]